MIRQTEQKTHQRDQLRPQSPTTKYNQCLVNGCRVEKIGSVWQICNLHGLTHAHPFPVLHSGDNELHYHKMTPLKTQQIRPKIMGGLSTHMISSLHTYTKLKAELTIHCKTRQPNSTSTHLSTHLVLFKSTWFGGKFFSYSPPLNPNQ